MFLDQLGDRSSVLVKELKVEKLFAVGVPKGSVKSIKENFQALVTYNLPSDY
jgi:hypothetical protein